MASMVIQVQSIGPYDTGGDVFYTGIARCEGMTAADRSLSWNVLLPANSTPAALQDAIKTAAMAAAADAGIAVDVADVKLLLLTPTAL